MELLETSTFKLQCYQTLTGVLLSLAMSVQAGLRTEVKVAMCELASSTVLSGVRSSLWFCAACSLVEFMHAVAVSENHTHMPKITQAQSS